MPKYIGDFKVIDNLGSINTRINVRGMMQSIANNIGKKIKGNLIGDGINGATAIDSGRQFLTLDKLLKECEVVLGKG